ncbi:MAG TPA: 4'-phosphopantetheinyl transferase superfamily protein [Bacteroidales bacterium]|jgi:phosphopantetheinyl transferase|nr:4'-phosphopantetheinyl transferase superfamily protein [Bacteroidales bacterium]
MGCITKHYLDEYSILGVWKIEEDIDALLGLVSLDNEEKKRFKGFSSTSRKLEFLSVRALLSELIGKDAHIVYNKNNKPFLKDGSRFISISHSHKLTAILLSVNEKVGIDLEYMSTNIAAIAFKFLNRKEKVAREADEKRYHLYIHWCAKEALYKICDKEGISIRKNLTIEPFKVQDSGEIKGHVHTDKINESFDLFYSKYDNYAIVWTKKKL